MKKWKYSVADIVRILEERIEDLQEENVPPNSVMGGILLGLIEAYDLITEEEE